MCGHCHTEKLPYTGVLDLIFMLFPPEPLLCINTVHVLQWMERKPDGGVVFRSVRAEEREDRRHNINKQKAMEVLYAKIQSEFEKEERGRSNICICVMCSVKWNKILNTLNFREKQTPA